jgi:hypothetical protein
VTALAAALAFAAAVAGLLAWRWMSLTYESEPVEIDPVKVQEVISDIDRRIGEHESKLNALMLERGLRTSKESRA